MRTHPTEQYQSRCCVIRREMHPLYCHGLAMFNIDSLCSLNNANKAHLPDVHPSESSLKPAFSFLNMESNIMLWHSDDTSSPKSHTRQVKAVCLNTK